MKNTVNITFWTSMKLHETPCLTTAHKAAHATNCASSQFWGGKTINDRDSSQGNTIWLWHCQFAMERSTMLLIGKPSISIRAIEKPWRTVSHNQRVMDIKQINSGWNNNMAMNEQHMLSFLREVTRIFSWQCMTVFGFCDMVYPSACHTGFLGYPPSTSPPDGASR